MTDPALEEGKRNLKYVTLPEKKRMENYLTGERKMGDNDKKRKKLETFKELYKNKKIMKPTA